MCGNVYQKQHNRGKHQNWHDMGQNMSHGMKYSPVAKMFILIIILFMVTKAWWLIFFVPMIFGPIAYACSQHNSDSTDKRKRDHYGDDNPFYPEDDRLHHARPVKRDKTPYDPYNGETIIL